MAAAGDLTTVGKPASATSVPDESVAAAQPEAAPVGPDETRGADIENIENDAPDAEAEDAEEPVYKPVIRYDAEGNPIDPCRRFDAQYDSWLDRSQVGLYRTVCSTAAWFDGFFGDSRYDEKTGDTYGRFSIGGFYDRRNHFDEAIRLRANYAFPAARRRASFFLRQGDEQAVVEGRGSDGNDQAVEALTGSQDTALFAGFGFDKRRNLERGFSLRIGAKVRLPLETFVKARYRYGWRVSDTTLMRVRPVVYWKSDERLGATLGFQVDQYIGDAFLLRWDNTGNVSQDPSVQGLRWSSSLILFQALSKRRAMTYSAFAAGETQADSKLQNYGLEIKFRHRFLRDWLFLEYVGSGTWPRETRDERREFNPGFGVRFEAYFGPNPKSALR